MILNEMKKDVTVAGEFEQSDFTIQADPKAFNILSDKIYTNKVKAVIREISTNAYDAHVAANNDASFDVHLPTTLEPWFTVRDYGTGLSHKDCMMVYTTYFMSTKTHSNDFVGALGLGSKSPFSLTDSFTVTSYFNGTKSTYSAYKDEEDRPQFALLTEEDTDEPNGLEVSLPVVRDLIYRFSDEAVEVYAHFDSIPNININHVKESAETYYDKYPLKNDMFATTTKWGDIKCVMGNVCYELKHGDIQHEMSGTDIILRFNIGEINFTPGRESLSLDKRTVENIKNRLDMVKEKITEELQKQINTCETYFDAKKLYGCINIVGHHKYNRKGQSIITWKGEDLDKTRTISPVTIYWKESYRQVVDKMERDSLFYDDKSEFFFKKPGYVGRIREYLKNKSYGTSYRVILIEEDQIVSAGLDKSLVRDLEELPSVHNARSYGPVNKCKTYKWTGTTAAKDSWEECEIDLNDGEERVYVEISRWEIVNGGKFTSHLYDVQRTFNALESKVNKPEIYGIKKAFTKTKAFQKSNFIKLNDYIKRELVDVVPTGPICTYSGSNGHFIKKVQGLVDIEIFDEFVKLYSGKCKQLFINILKEYGFEIAISNRLQDIDDEICDRYPMLKLLDSWGMERHSVVISEYIKKMESCV